jgi:hypothetical protein
VLYGGRPGQELLTVIRGKIQFTPRGGLLITEAQGGHVREVDAADRVVWEYVNRYSDEEVAELDEARLYPAAYFDVGDWSCPGGRAPTGAMATRQRGVESPSGP